MSENTNPTWELVKKIAHANNNQEFDKVYELIATNDFTDKKQAAEAVLASLIFEPTKLIQNKECLEGFIEQIKDHEFDWRTDFQLALLKSLLEDTTSHSDNLTTKESS